MIPLIKGTQSSQIHRDRKKNAGGQGQERMGIKELLFNDYGFQFMNMKRIQEMDGGDGCTKYKCT